MRLIDADALKAYIDAQKNRPFIVCTIGEALKIMTDEQPTIEERKWIPCNWHTKEENLPQECKSVLICMKDSYGYRIGVSYRADYNRWEGFGRVNVIAWMPLPEPYTEEST